MIRRGILALALVLVCGAAAQLIGETRYVLGASTSIQTLLAAGSGPPSGVVFVFQPEDCLDRGEMVERWNRMYTARRFPVSGRVVGSGALSDRQARFFRDLNVRMPVHGIAARDAGSAAEKLGYTKTPFAVILDDAGRVAGSFPASQNIPAEVVEGILRSR
ncbi:MAG TPA: hypothetical protein VLK84_25090 [Longimicrobium sp.]|nr:hypothetical protein [Longimicrobium sp.]